jgi:hypothetical protein
MHPMKVISFGKSKFFFSIMTPVSFQQFKTVVSTTPRECLFLLISLT